MAVSRIVAGVLLLVVLALAGWEKNLETQVAAEETRWSTQLCAMTPTRTQKLKDYLNQTGASLAQVGNSFKITFTGNHKQWVGLVNRLLAEPIRWEAWSSTMDKEGNIDGKICVTGL